MACLSGRSGLDYVARRPSHILIHLFSRVTSVLTCYAHPEPFAIDLAGAVIRQGKFIKKVVDLGWTDAAQFNGIKEASVLVRSVARYHAFLSLMSNSKALFVPTIVSQSFSYSVRA